MNMKIDSMNAQINIVIIVINQKYRSRKRFGWSFQNNDVLCRVRFGNEGQRNKC
jgi:hypothetical protein